MSDLTLSPVAPRPGDKTALSTCPPEHAMLIEGCFNLTVRAEKAEREVVELRAAIKFLLGQFTPEHIDAVSGTDVGAHLALLTKGKP